MKKGFMILMFFLFISICHSQVKEIFYEIEDIENIKESKGYLDGIYEISLIIFKNNNDFDSYEFVFNSNETKSFIENGIEMSINDRKIYRKKDFEIYSSCELHEFLSGKYFNILYKDRKTNKYKKWMFMYQGTAKNTITTNSRNKI